MFVFPSIGPLEYSANPGKFGPRQRPGPRSAVSAIEIERVVVEHHRHANHGVRRRRIIEEGVGERKAPRASPPHAHRSACSVSRSRARYMLPSPSLNLIPVHTSQLSSVKLVRSRPPASGGHFFYVIVRPGRFKDNRKLPIVAIWSPKRRAANKLRGKRGRRQTAARRTRGRGHGEKGGRGRPEERAHREKTHGKARLGKAGARGGRGVPGGAVFVAATGRNGKQRCPARLSPSSWASTMVPLFGMNVSTIGDL